METGEKEIRQAFEEVTTRNVKGAIEYSTETRKLVRLLEEKVSHLENTIISKDVELNAMKQQIAWLQQQIYKGGLS